MQCIDVASKERESEKNVQAELSADGCISPLRWGITRTAAGQELEKLDGAEVISTGDERIKLETVLMGCSATVYDNITGAEGDACLLSIDGLPGAVVEAANAEDK